MPWAVFIASAKQAAEGRQGWAPDTFPAALPAGLRLDPSAPSPLPFCRTGAAASGVAAPAKGYGQSQKPVDGEEQFRYRSAKRSVSSKC